MFAPSIDLRARIPACEQVRQRAQHAGFCHQRSLRGRSLHGVDSVNAVSSRPAALCALGLGFLSVFCQAAEAPQLPSVVVTATRTAQPLANVLSDVRVIGSETIRDAGAVTLTELLQLHGGAEIAANGGPGQNSSVFLRGSNAGHVVLLVDGVRLNSASAGLNAWENIPLAQIERIEIVRGAASGLYGADAIGGVVQIFTPPG